MYSKLNIKVVISLITSKQEMERDTQEYQEREKEERI